MLFVIGIVSAVSIPPTPVPSFIGVPTGGMSGFSVTFTASVSGSPNPDTTYTWDFGDGATSTGIASTIIHPYVDTPGKYTVTLVANGTYGPSHETWAKTVIREEYITIFHPAPSASFTPVTATEVGPANLSFHSTSTGYIEKLTWNFDDGTGTVEGVDVTHQFAEVGSPENYHVKLNASGDGAFDIETHTVTINPKPPVAVLEVVTSPVGVKPFVVQFDGRDSTGYDLSYNWTFGDTGHSTDSHPTHTYTNNGTYLVNLTVKSDHGTYGSSSASTTIVVLNTATDVCPTPIVCPDPILCPTPTPVRQDIGIYKDGVWYLDVNGNGIWNSGIDKVFSFGSPGWQPVKGDWNNDGVQEAGIYKDGVWYLDQDGSGTWNAGDKLYSFGSVGAVPVVGDWTGSGVTRIGVYKAGLWYLDLNNNGVWDSGTDRFVTGFGLPGWEPVPGKWS